MKHNYVYIQCILSMCTNKLYLNILIFFENGGQIIDHDIYGRSKSCFLSAAAQPSHSKDWKKNGSHCFLSKHMVFRG